MNNFIKIFTLPLIFFIIGLSIRTGDVWDYTVETPSLWGIGVFISVVLLILLLINSLLEEDC